MCVYLPEDEHLDAAPQLRPTPADERHSEEIAVTVAWALVDTNDSLPTGPCAEPYWKTVRFAVSRLSIMAQGRKISITSYIAPLGIQSSDVQSATSDRSSRYNGASLPFLPVEPGVETYQITDVEDEYGLPVSCRWRNLQVSYGRCPYRGRERNSRVRTSIWHSQEN